MNRLMYLLFLTVFLNCQNVERPEKPSNLIPKDKMVEVLTESYIANAARGVGSKNLLVKDVKMDSLIYNKFGIDSIQFVKSNEYYAAEINDYIEIFEKVEANLAVMNKEMDSIRSLIQPDEQSVKEKDSKAENLSL